MSVAWYINRLRTMDPRELVHRVREQASVVSLARAQRQLDVASRSFEATHYAFCVAPSPVLPRLDWDVSANYARAEELLDGRWPALGFDWRWSDSPTCWQRAPDTGADWPLVYFSRVSHREGNPHGDARVVWEPARLQQLVSLALLCGRACYRAPAVALLERQLLSWFVLNPPYLGVHYKSAMECALRLIAVCHAVDMVRGFLNEPAPIWRAVIGIVSSHARLIHRRLSLHSSAGNHTIAEAVGLLYAGLLFPELDSAATWASTGNELLTRELMRQVLPDGGGIEQAPAYLKQIVELSTLALALPGSACPPARISDRIAAARRFLAETRGESAHRATIGDDDNGHALSPFLREPSRPGRSPRIGILYPNAGMTILRSRTGGHQITFDHGALGMAPLHGHGHADALSITWRQGDRDLLTDPGTFTYSGKPDWRRYFRSTRAHNTVTIDGRDQAKQDSAFAWRDTPTVHLVKSQHERHSLVLATHDGYLDVHVRHWRGLVYDHAGRLVVWDYLTGRGVHEASVWWHTGIAARLEPHAVTLDDNVGALNVIGCTRTVRYFGSTAPIAGWRSPRYGVREPIVTIEATMQGALPLELTTVIAVDDERALEPNACERAHIATLRRWTDES